MIPVWFLCSFYNIFEEMKRPFTNLLQRNWKTLVEKYFFSLTRQPKSWGIIGHFAIIELCGVIRYNGKKLLWAV